MKREDTVTKIATTHSPLPPPLSPLPRTGRIHRKTKQKGREGRGGGKRDSRKQPKKKKGKQWKRETKQKNEKDEEGSLSACVHVCTCDSCDLLRARNAMQVGLAGTMERKKKGGWRQDSVHVKGKTPYASRFSEYHVHRLFNYLLPYISSSLVPCHDNSRSSPRLRDTPHTTMQQERHRARKKTSQR